MANARYQLGMKHYAQGEVAWKASGGATIRAVLLDGATYTPNLAADEFFDDLPSGARVGNGGASSRASMPALTLLDAAANGVCDADDTTFIAVPVNPTGNGTYEMLALFMDTGADATSPLLFLLDTIDVDGDPTAMAILTNGGDVVIQWPAAGIFTL